MIHARILFDEQREFVGFHISGHAGYESAGKDIVCAGVSTLVYTFVGSVMDLLEDPYRYDVDGTSATFKFRFKAKPSKEGSLLFRSFLLGLEQMEDIYGEYLTLTDYQKSNGKYIKSK